MAKKFLIFRTDRIGDFLLTAILIKAIKRNDPNSHISIVASSKNYEYIKSFDEVNYVFLLKNSFFYKLKFIYEIRKYFYDHVIVHDNKKRSLLISLFCKFKSRITIDKNKNENYINKIKKILLVLNYNYLEQDLNFLDNRNTLNYKNKDNYILFHFDEKWIYNDYIKDYTNIEPSDRQLEKFILSVCSKTNKNLIITTGINIPKKLENIIKKINNSKITFLSNLNFIGLESVVLQSSLIICCHGSISHLASAYNVKQIDIIEFNKLKFYQMWTDHFRNHNFIFRKNFNELSNEIIKMI